MDLTVVIPTHNPHPGRLRRTLAGLRGQTLAPARWELLVVDNASAPAVDLAPYADVLSANSRAVREMQLGLTPARRRGFAEARGELMVLVDDDNVLAPDYLERVLTLFADHPRLGALGGRSIAEFESAPPAVALEFIDLLACRDLGNAPLLSSGLRDPATGRNEYPLCAPIGAGMALRKAAMQSWLADSRGAQLPDRRGGQLSSSGDNDIVLTLMESGWEVGYFPELQLSHLIPAGRTEPDYLARLNRGIAKSWMQVLRQHDANPWPPIAGWTVPLRQLKAWFTNRAWQSPAARIRWQGACGHFEGRVVQSP